MIHRRSLRGVHSTGQQVVRFKKAERDENDDRIRAAIRAMSREGLSSSEWTFSRLAGRAGVSTNTVRRRPFAVAAVLRHNPAADRKKADGRHVADLKARIGALQKRIDQLEAELSVLQVGSDSLNSQNASLRRDNTILREKLRQLGHGDAGRVTRLY